MDISRTHTTLHQLGTNTTGSLPSNEWLISPSQEVLRSTQPNNSSQSVLLTNCSTREHLKSILGDGEGISISWSSSILLNPAHTISQNPIFSTLSTPTNSQRTPSTQTHHQNAVLYPRHRSLRCPHFSRSPQARPSRPLPSPRYSSVLSTRR